MSETQKAVGREILGRKENAQRKRIEIPEWGGSVLVRQLSARQVADLRTMAVAAVDTAKQQVKDQIKLTRFNFALIRESWIDEEGEPVLTDADYEAIVGEPNSVIAVLVTEISEFNHLDEGAARNAKKNLGQTQNGASGSS